MRIVVRAPLLSISGYGQHSRQVFEAVKKIPASEVFTQIVQWGNTSWFIDQEAEGGLVGDVMKRSTDQQTGFDVSFQVQLPDEWTPTLAKINVGITAAVETDVCNPAWVESCNKMSAIIVPSSFTRSVLEKSGKINVPVYVIPEWFIEEIEKVDSYLDIPLRTEFNFLIVSQLTSVDSSVDRKNIVNTIKWICESFKDDKSVGIVLKTNSGRGTTIDKGMTSQAIRSVVSQIRSISKVPVYFIHGNMTNEEISRLYRNPKIKALVSLTRGEGFGLPLLEAAASGLPVIATDWSAHTEFLNTGKWIKIEHDMIDVPESRIDGRIFVAGSKWANPSEDIFKKKIRKFRDSSETPTQWARELSALCRSKFSRDSILKMYERTFIEILSNA
jgi:glycosyltransferase involved in cell wall biosynthesis